MPSQARLETTGAVALAARFVPISDNPRPYFRNATFRKRRRRVSGSRNRRTLRHKDGEILFLCKYLRVANRNLLTRKPTHLMSSRSFDFVVENAGTQIARDLHGSVPAHGKPRKDRFSVFDQPSDETVGASPAPVDTEFFIRGEVHLFCFASGHH
jgi:hypothetical protein